jgi:hypothetical protein
MLVFLEGIRGNGPLPARVCSDPDSERQCLTIDGVKPVGLDSFFQQGSQFRISLKLDRDYLRSCVGLAALSPELAFQELDTLAERIALRDHIR